MLNTVPIKKVVLNTIVQIKEWKETMLQYAKSFAPGVVVLGADRLVEMLQKKL